MTDAAFWDRIAHRYASRPIADMDAYEATLARVRTYLSGTDSVLELGCGTGSTALLLAPCVSAYEGTDISSSMIDIAVEKSWNAGVPNLTFRTAGVSAADHSGATRDKVLAFNLLHLVRNTEATLAMIHALLPEGGLFISKTPCIGEKWYFRPLVRAMQIAGKAPFVRHLKIGQLERMVAAAGFEIVETGLYPAKSSSRFIVARKG